MRQARYQQRILANAAETRDHSRLYDRGQRKQLLEEIQFTMSSLSTAHDREMRRSLADRLFLQTDEHRLELAEDVSVLKMYFEMLVRKQGWDNSTGQVLLFCYTTLIMALSSRARSTVELSCLSVDSITAVLNAINNMRTESDRPGTKKGNNDPIPASTATVTEELAPLARKRKFSGKRADINSSATLLSRSPTMTSPSTATATALTSQNYTRSSSGRPYNQLSHEPLDEHLLAAVFLSRVFLSYTIQQSVLETEDDTNVADDENVDQDSSEDNHSGTVRLKEPQRALDRLVWLKTQNENIQRLVRDTGLLSVFSAMLHDRLTRLTTDPIQPPRRKAWLRAESWLLCEALHDVLLRSQANADFVSTVQVLCHDDHHQRADNTHNPSSSSSRSVKAMLLERLFLFLQRLSSSANGSGANLHQHGDQEAEQTDDGENQDASRSWLLRHLFLEREAEGEKEGAVCEEELSQSLLKLFICATHDAQALRHCSSLRRSATPLRWLFAQLQHTMEDLSSASEQARSPLTDMQVHCAQY